MPDKTSLTQLTLPKDITDKLEPGKTLELPESLANGIQSNSYCRIGEYKAYVIGIDPKDKIYEIHIVEKIRNGNRTKDHT